MERIGTGEDKLEYEIRLDGNTEIVDLVVRSERRKGIGTQMVKRLISMRPKTHWVFAITRHDNRIAQSFYSALGFEVLAYLRNFYGDREDAVMYGFRRGLS